MKITRVRINDDTIEIMTGGKWSQLGGYRPTLASQGAVSVHPDLKAPGVVIMQDPSDETSQLLQIDDAIDDPALAQLQTDWAAGLVESAELPWPA